MSRVQRRRLLVYWTALLAAPLVRAQSPERMRRIGVLMGYAENDPEARLFLAAFKERLAVLGWVDGRNLTIDLRWASGDANRASELARDLVTLGPEVILSQTTPVTAALKRETRTIPIVFLAVADPVGSGLVKTLARPGGNITGFLSLESSLIEKLLQLLKEIDPRVTRVAVMFNPQTASYAKYYLQPLNAAAPKLGVTTFTASVSSNSEIEQVIHGLGRKPGSGLIAMPDSFLIVHRKLIIELTAHEKVPAIYFTGNFAEQGGLISYGVNYSDLFKRAATSVDRILRGAQPTDMPVELPIRFELVINKKTADTLRLTIPQLLLVRADRVIE